MARLLPLLSLALALILSSASPAAAQTGVSVQAPFTNVNVATDGGGGGNSNSNSQDDGWHRGHCLPHHAWWMAHHHCPGGLFFADLSGKKMIAPNSATPAPIDTPANGWAWVCVIEEDGQKKIVTRLTVCDIKGYVASHHHFGGPNRDLAAPVVPLEPAQKPTNPTGPPQSLPMLTPPIDVPSDGVDQHHHHYPNGCRTVEVTSGPHDLIVVPGGPQSWDDLLKAAVAGDVYVNAHTVAHPDGEIRGNLERCDV